MKVLYKFEEKNIDILLQRRSLEYITDELLQDISKSLTKVEKNYQNLIDIQNQLESQTNRLSYQENHINDLKEKLDTDISNKKLNTSLTSSLGVAGAASAPLLMSGPIGWIAGGVGLLTTIIAADKSERQGEAICEADREMLRGAKNDLEKDREKDSNIRQRMTEEEKLQDGNVWATLVKSKLLQ